MKIPRHNLAIRFTHWVTALSIFILIFTGFGQMPVYKRYFVDQLPGLAWSSNYSVTLQLHYWAAIILIFISVYYLTYVIITKERDIFPRKGDLRESMQIFAALIGLAEEPESDKYLAEQRLAFAVTAMSILALIATGILKVYKNLPGNDVSSTLVFWTAQVHNLFTVVLLLSIIFHVAAFLIKANRPLLPSMFTGNISEEYIKSRHSIWWEKLQARQKDPRELLLESDKAEPADELEQAREDPSSLAASEKA